MLYFLFFFAGMQNYRYRLNSGMHNQDRHIFLYIFYCLQHLFQWKGNRVNKIMGLKVKASLFFCLLLC